jgi:hypothetical protein
VPLREWESRRKADPKAIEVAAKTSMVSLVHAMSDFHAQGILTERSSAFECLLRGVRGT